MPIFTEVTIDSGLKISSSELNDRLMNTKIRINALLKYELAKRGYGVKEFEKEFSDLNNEIPNDEIIKNAVLEFVSQASQTTHQGKSTQPLVNSLFPSENLIIDDSNGKKIELISGEFGASKKKNVNALVAKTLDAKNLFPAEIDTIMYIYIKSYVAKRGISYSITDNSFTDVEIKIINLTKEEVVFSDKEGEVKTDILDWTSFKDNIANVLVRIPAKL